ncbi:MAG: EutP/PduV family microcompartment system protein [Ruminococcus sp.]|nr:EutP/PduV family microcompartment system protein [Ruminococcus sp.]
MKRIIFMGRSGAGKTTLTQKIKNKPIEYHKTQYINFHDMIIDTPGEYAENSSLAAALALYSYEADVVGLMISATDQYSLFPPNITCMVNREVVGIVTHIDSDGAKPERAERWLRLSGCKRVFHVASKSGEGVDELVKYLSEC